jgi:hypothetical protein
LGDVVRDELVVSQIRVWNFGRAWFGRDIGLCMRKSMATSRGTSRLGYGGRTSNVFRIVFGRRKCPGVLRGECSGWEWDLPSCNLPELC